LRLFSIYLGCSRIASKTIRRYKKFEVFSWKR